MSHITSKSSPIVIVGAGVFGLSTALHLAERGYTNVKLLDKQAYNLSHYSYDKGCDAASADINKIIRSAYGSQFQYQELARDAMAKWKKWNDEIKTGKTVPAGFSTDSVLFVNNGCLTMTSGSEMDQFEKDTIQNMTKVGLRDTQLNLNVPSDVARARGGGFGFVADVFNINNKTALLDTRSGFVYADKACQFALAKVQKLGVELVLGGPKGTFAGLLQDASRTNGVLTADGKAHKAELTIMACGGWTPSLLTQLDNLCETTAGSVTMFQLPPNNKALWDRFAPENFPTWSHDIRRGKCGGLYGFARDPNGVVKIGYRGAKFTNPQIQADGTARSVPATRWTQEAIRQIPLTAARVIKAFIQEQLPELLDCEMNTRLCWYTDSYDNHFVIDFVPGTSGLMVATGGSGHGFKFLPNLGEHVVDKIENRQNDYLQYWKWRSLESGKTAYNSIMEGTGSDRSLHHQPLTAGESLSGRLSRL